MRSTRKVSALNRTPSSTSTAMISANVARIASGSGSPKPSKSRSRVGRRGSSNQVVRSIAPLRTNRSACAEMLSLYSSRSSANRTRTRSNGWSEARDWLSNWHGPRHRGSGASQPSRVSASRYGAITDQAPNLRAHSAITAGVALRCLIVSRSASIATLMPMDFR